MCDGDFAEFGRKYPTIMRCDRGFAAVMLSPYVAFFVYTKQYRSWRWRGAGNQGKEVL